MSGELTIRTANEAEFSIAIDWARAEGWNPGLDDLSAFMAADPHGFLMGFVDSEPVASISVVRYGASYGFLGFYIAHPEYRGQGHGMALWQAGIDYLANRTIGLDGVVAQQDNYRKSGFELVGRNVRFSGSPEIQHSPPDAATIRTIRPSDLAALVDYDRPFFADNRQTFIEAWALPSTATRRKTHIAIANGAITGYGTIRACHEGHKIGPLFADTPDIAQALFTSLTATAEPGAMLVLDVPEDNQEAVQLAQSQGMKSSFETARMYRGPAPSLPLSRTFGITSFELG